MNYIVSVPVNENVASFIGKKSSEEGLVFFNRKLSNDVIVAIMPQNREEKVYYSMAETMLISGQVVISTDPVDKFLGEVLVAASLLDRHVILLDENDVSKIVSGLLKDFEVCGRDTLLDRIAAHGKQREGELRIDIDRAFPVKGIGTVILGIVTRGTVKVHDTLYHSSGKQVSIKSIQSQDIDVDAAGYGTRVGLAVKGLEYDEAEKGDLLLPGPFQRAGAVMVTIKSSSFANEKMEQGRRYTFVSNFSRVVAKIGDIDGQNAKLDFEKPTSVMPGDEFVLVREQSPHIFAAGKVVSVH
jgi:selenocysteine-specific translation elongation factor